jgi:hypothetical protein
MKTTSIVFALTVAVLALSQAARAQSGAPRLSPTPTQSFSADILITDWKARLDYLAVELQNRPDSHGYIVAYSEKYRFFGWPLRRGNPVLNYLTQTRGIDANRVSVLSGGFRDKAEYEFWVIGPGEELPVKPLDFSLAFAGEKSPIMFDRYYLYSSWEDWGEDGNLDVYSKDHDRAEYFVKFLQADPALRGLIIVYATRRDRRGTDRRLAAREKRLIMSNHPVEPDRLIAIAGGLRPHKTVELWLIPPGAELPKPTPTVRRRASKSASKRR